MATSIPPHNLGEVIDACVALIDDPELDTGGVMKHLRGPDFPTGGQVVSSKRELAKLYDAGSGTFKLRGEWRLEGAKGRGNPHIVLTSIPYAVDRGNLVMKIGDVAAGRKLPVLLDVRDESTDDTRVVLEIKKGADPQLVMAYLYKHTPLETNVQINLTCLVPAGEGADEVPTPRRLSLLECLRYFLDFRMEVVERRLGFDLRKILERIHLLEGFVIVFDALDETLRIIRRSDGRGTPGPSSWSASG
jgi:DNA gyrase subunit A